MHTLGTIRGTRVRLSSLRSQRVVGRGAPRGMTKMRYEVLAIFGPTASGKSEVAQALADRIGTEVVSADALQVYRGLPILTNQPAGSTRLVAIRDVSETMSVGEYAKLAQAEIDELVASTGSAVVAGGTGLYLRAALADLEIPPAVTSATRARLERLYDDDPDGAYARLRELDAAASAAVHRNDRRRVVRALGLAEAGFSLVPMEDMLWSTHLRRPTLVVGLEVPSERLERRIVARTAAMVERGVVDEVRAVVQSPVSATAGKALGLHELATLPVAEAEDRIAVRTRRYAAYQRKWMRRIPGLVAIDADRPAAEVVDAILDVARAR
jgi:tRNA dimethylallyltransferase